MLLIHGNNGVFQKRAISEEAEFKKNLPGNLHKSISDICPHPLSQCTQSQLKQDIL